MLALSLFLASLESKECHLCFFQLLHYAFFVAQLLHLFCSRKSQLKYVVHIQEYSSLVCGESTQLTLFVATEMQRLCKKQPLSSDALSKIPARAQLKWFMLPALGDARRSIPSVLKTTVSMQRSSHCIGGLQLLSLSCNGCKSAVLA